MTKTLLIFFITVFVSGCSYEPIMTAKNYHNLPAYHKFYLAKHKDNKDIKCDKQ